MLLFSNTCNITKSTTKNQEYGGFVEHHKAGISKENYIVNY